MKPILTTTLLSLTLLLASCAEEPSKNTSQTDTQNAQSTASTQSKPETKEDRVSYSIGVDIGNSLKAAGITVNMPTFSQGISDAMGGSTLEMTPEEMQQTLAQFQTELIEKQTAEMEALGAKNLAAQQAFLAQNGQQSGIVTTASGLQYRVLHAGNGPIPTANDVVVVNYTGTLEDGTVFDSSYERGQPAVFPVSGVIAGWTEALQMMPVGSKWQLFVPSDLAYGDRSPGGGVIGPNQLLIFEVELMGIENPEENESDNENGEDNEDLDEGDDNEENNS